MGLKAVIRAGADAVYIGGEKFGARAYADNPGADDLIEGLDFAHLRDRKVYLTVNTLLKGDELDQLVSYVRPYYEAGIDAVLVQDFGVLKILHEAYPDLPLHASTQMTVTGPLWAKELEKYGVTRVVPARELSLTELKRLKEKSGLEVEVFIHGALCVCYSGQCLYSSMLGGRSGNRGRCAQPCRLLYLMDDQTGFDGRTSILEQKEARHFLSPKDLNGIDALPELVRSGMDSLKIEGRMKRPEYAAGVVSIYRKYLDLALSGQPYQVSREDRKMLYDLYNRTGFTDGYFHRHNGPEMMAPIKHELTREETAARHALYEAMGGRYMKECLFLPVRGRLQAFTGQPLTLTLSSKGRTVEVLGDPVLKAQNRPLSPDRMEENIRKTGGTDFVMDQVDIKTDGGSFLPMKALNEIRRKGLAALKEEILSPYQRKGTEDLEPAPNRKRKNSDRGGEDPTDLKIRVLVSTLDQLKVAQEAEAVREIYVESFLLRRLDRDPVEAAREILAKSPRDRISIALPFIDRAVSEERELKKHARDLKGAGLGNFLVRSPETLAYFTGHQLTDLVRADAGLYTYNRAAEAMLREEGVGGDTAPVELNKKELWSRDNRTSEIIAYGRLPLMVTAQCLEKNQKGCTRCYATHTITDRMGVQFSVKCICDFCYNVIYNSVPLSLLSETRALRAMGFEGIRLQFTDEDGETTRSVIETAAANLLQGEKREVAGKHTKGHFSRGVE